jgi:hypothetical protein
MSNIVDITERQPHEAGPVVCWGCLHEWVAVRPKSVRALECPMCGRQRGLSLDVVMAFPEEIMGDECCGQVDSDGICMASACTRGDALRMHATMRRLIEIEFFDNAGPCHYEGH